MNFVDIYQKYWKNGYTLTDLSLSGIDREVFRSLFNPVAEVFRKYPAGDVHLYIPGVGQVNGLQPGNYFDSVGTTLASVDGSVGLVLDAAGSVGAELVTNGDFSQGSTNWSLSAGWVISGGAASCTSSTLNINQIISASSAGKTFKVEFDLVVISGSIRAELGASTGGTFSSSGRYSTYITAANADQHLYIYGVTSFTGSIDNVSCKQITGTHATQSTPGYKPTLRKGIVNLLTWSNDLTNAGYVKVAATATANIFTPDTSNGLHRFQSIATPMVAGTPYTYAVRAQVNGYRYLYINGAAGANTGQVCFDLQNGTVAATANGVGTIQAVGDGSYVCAVSAIGSGTSNTCLHQVNDTGVAADRPFVGDGTSGIYSHARGLFQGTLTAAQILAAGGIPLTTTAPASSVAGVNYLEFDGVDDRLSLGGPLFQMADDFVVVSGASVDQAANSRVMFAQAAGGASESLPELSFDSNGKLGIWISGGGLQLGLYPGAAETPGAALVATARKTGSTINLRRNSVVTGSAITSGTYTTATAAALGIVPRLSYTGYYKGRMFPLIAIKGTVSDADLLVLEKFVAQLSGVQL